MNNVGYDYDSLPLRKIPGQIDLELQGFEFSLHDTSEWKTTAKPKIPNPIEFIENYAVSMNVLKRRWEEWKSAKPNEATTIAEYEEKLKKCDAYLNLMAEVLLEEDKPATIQPDTREKTVLEQTTSQIQVPVPPKEEKEIPVAPWEHLKTVFEKGSPEEIQKQFNDFLAHPQDFIEPKDGENYLKGFSFHECGCKSYGRTTANKRQNAENIIVEEISSSIENKNEMLRLASVGAGGLLEDLIILGKLIQKGFKNIHITFTDNYPDSDQAKILEDMLNKLPGVTIKSLYCPFLHSKSQFHAIYATDFDELYKDRGNGWSAICQAKNTLLDKGKLYLFGGGEQLVLDKDNNITYLIEHTETLVEKLRQSPCLAKLQKVDAIHITIIKDKSKLNFDLPGIAKMLQFLSKEFNKQMNIELYGNELFPSAYRLDGYPTQTTLKELSGLNNLNVNYYGQNLLKQPPSQSSLKAHILIKEQNQANPTVEFGSF